jgi:hypothetical protein
MAIEYATVAPFMDNWTIYRQLWQGDARSPGSELDLIPIGRSLTVQWRDLETGVVVLAFTEFSLNSPIAVVDRYRGIVSVTLSGNQWNALRSDRSYTCEILAYGLLYDSFLFQSGLPEPHHEILNGVEVYGSPRQVLELLGRIPGADVETLVDLSGSWTLNDRGYWTKAIAQTQQLYGFWINDVHAKQVNYSELGLCERAIARVDNTLYYKGSEDLADFATYVETAYSAYVRRSLAQGTIEFERRSAQFFNKRRVFREVHRGLSRQLQAFPRVRPVVVDRYFRLDSFWQDHTLYRRYTEDAFKANDGSLYLEPETGMLTLNTSASNWYEAEYTGSIGGNIGVFAYLGRGNNSIELTYTAGYDKPPIDVAQAVSMLAASNLLVFWERAVSQGMSSLSIGCATMNFPDAQKYIQPWAASVDAIVANYQSFEIEVL